MKREIKFRAKIVMDIESFAMKKGHWVEGHYYEDLQDGEQCSWIQECNDIIHYKVDKETVGQFTGLLDKNSNEIYFDDIIANKYGDTGHVIWYNNGIGIDWGNDYIHYIESDDELEIIGNIFDNPELLKGGIE